MLRPCSGKNPVIGPKNSDGVASGVPNPLDRLSACAVLPILEAGRLKRGAEQEIGNDLTFAKGIVPLNGAKIWPGVGREVFMRGMKTKVIDSMIIWVGEKSEMIIWVG